MSGVRTLQSGAIEARGGVQTGSGVRRCEGQVTDRVVQDTKSDSLQDRF